MKFRKYYDRPESQINLFFKNKEFIEWEKLRQKVELDTTKYITY